MYYHKACILVRRTAGHIFRVLARRTSYIGDKLHSLSLYISHSRETTTNSLNLTATRQNYNDTSLCIAILSPVSNGYLHVWCSRVLGTVQFLIEVLESKRTIMISRLWQDNQCYWHSLLLVYYFNFAANTGYFGENYYVLIHAPEVDTLYSILVSSHPHTN